jgi:diaminopimelate decarboxylase
MIMKLHGTMKINSAGHLEIGGCDATELAQQFGTPLYVMDETLIRENCRSYVHSFRAAYPDSEVIYASKVFSTRAICQLMKEEDMGLDVVSAGELLTAVSVDFPVDRIYLHGNNKSPQELTMALQKGVRRIVCDSFYELELLNSIATGLGKKADILLRLSPGIDAHTHHYIKTGTIDSKFGFCIANGQAMEAVLAAESYPALDLWGVHCHIGSQIFDLDSYAEAAQTMMAFVAEMTEKVGKPVRELNLGGGLGIYYSEGDSPRQVQLYANCVAENVKACAAEYGLSLPRIIVEPGRSIVGEAGTTLYTIGAIKDIPSVRKYVAVDGGMTDNPRPALYQAKYEAALANRMNDENTDKVSIAGKCCESGDMLIWDLELPVANPGDILAVSSTGAYNYSMSSNYNRNLKPAVIFVAGGNARLVVQRETYEDLLRNDVLIGA